MTTHDTIAFAGAGSMAAVHATAISALDSHRGIPHCRVVAVAARTTASAAAFSASIGARVIDTDDLPGNAAVVLVATPPDEHVLPALQALAAGRAVIVETPLAARLSDADRLVRAVEGGGVLAYAENLLFSDAVQHARSAIASMGRVTHLSARAHRPAGTGHHECDPSSGGGVLLHVGIHPINVILRCRPDAEVVSVRADLHLGPDGVDDRARVELAFDDSTTATIETSWSVKSPVWDLQAASAAGVVRLELSPSVELEIDGEQVPNTPLPPDAQIPPELVNRGYLDVWADSLRAFDQNTSPGVADVHLGREALEIVHAAYASAGRPSSDGGFGAWIDVPVSADRTLVPLARWRPAHR